MDSIMSKIRFHVLLSSILAVGLTVGFASEASANAKLDKKAKEGGEKSHKCKIFWRKVKY